MTTNLFLIIIIVFLAVLIAVVAYNMYQENQYRRAVRRQFGHSDHDALMGSQTQSVRDGQYFGGIKLRRAPVVSEIESPKDDTRIMAPEQHIEPAIETESAGSLHTESEPIAVEPITVTEVADEAPIESVVAEKPHTHSLVFTEIVAHDDKKSTNEIISLEQEDAGSLHTPAQRGLFEEREMPVVAPVVPQAARDERRLLIDVADLACNPLPWFDTRFDYMAHIALYQPKELHALPRLSGRHQFQIIGCTMDGRFQLAEPIPGVHYQAFVIGLQSISRNGLASRDELLHFQQQVCAFTDRMDGQVQFDDVDAFLTQAQPLDELCARVDQTIAIHLVSRSANVLGVELRAEVEKAGFVLQDDGVFTMAGFLGDAKYTLTTLDGTPFTEALLSSQPYKGFSLLFDITRVPDGEEEFNQFISLAVRLSGTLNLDLVDDQVRQLSSDWLKEVRTYICARQDEMQQIGIVPGSVLAKRLFS